jgi:hypothetical protein
MKNTKSEILDALKQALQRADQAEKGKLNPIKEEKELQNRKAIESTKKAVEQNIFSQELINKYNDLQTALLAEENRLQELYGVEREVQKLALVIEAAKERASAIEADHAEKETASKKSLEMLNAEHAQKSLEYRVENDSYLEKLKTERARETEDYQYNLKRTRERENNAWADEKAAREAELQKHEAQAAELLENAQSQVEYIKSLEEKVANIPSVLEAEKDMAIKATSEQLNREHAHLIALSEVEWKSAVSRLEDKVDYLERELALANKNKQELEQKLDKAYSEIRDLASKTVESASGVKIISGTEKSGS